MDVLLQVQGRKACRRLNSLERDQQVDSSLEIGRGNKQLRVRNPFRIENGFEAVSRIMGQEGCAATPRCAKLLFASEAVGRRSLASE